LTLTSIEDGLWEEEQLPEPDSKKGLKFICVVAQFADGLILGGGVVWGAWCWYFHPRAKLSCGANRQVVIPYRPIEQACPVSGAAVRGKRKYGK
jgi:hypothetical protein